MIRRASTSFANCIRCILRSRTRLGKSSLIWTQEMIHFNPREFNRSMFLTKTLVPFSILAFCRTDALSWIAEKVLSLLLDQFVLPCIIRNTLYFLGYRVFLKLNGDRAATTFLFCATSHLKVCLWWDWISGNLFSCFSLKKKSDTFVKGISLEMCSWFFSSWNITIRSHRFLFAFWIACCSAKRNIQSKPSLIFSYLFNHPLSIICAQILLLQTVEDQVVPEVDWKKIRVDSSLPLFCQFTLSRYPTPTSFPSALQQFWSGLSYIFKYQIIIIIQA